MPDQSEILQNALRTIDNLETLPDDLLRVDQNLLATVVKKLKCAEGRQVTSLFAALEAARTKIEAYTEKPVDEAVLQSVDWQDADFRVHDLRLGANKHSPLTKFRKCLAERSLAMQFHEWETREFGHSRLTDFQKNPGLQNRKDGNIPDFIAIHKLPDDPCVTKGIQHGTKILLFEYLSRTPCASAIIFFCFTQFRAVHYVDLPAMRDTFNKVEWINTLCKSKKDWFEQCLDEYASESDESSLSDNADFMIFPAHFKGKKRSMPERNPTQGSLKRARIPGRFPNPDTMNSREHPVADTTNATVLQSSEVNLNPEEQDDVVNGTATFLGGEGPDRPQVDEDQSWEEWWADWSS